MDPGNLDDGFYVAKILEHAERLGLDSRKLTAEERKELIFEGRILTAEERKEHAEWLAKMGTFKRSTPEEMQEFWYNIMRHNRQVSAFDHLPSRVKSSFLKQWYETHVLKDGKRLEQMTFWEVIGELVSSLLVSASNYLKDTPAEKK